MTYSSRNFLISCGTGSEVRAPPRASNLLSSAMMSLQTSTHSSQMKTVGPAMSLRTSRWLLLQNEQRRVSSPVSRLGISPPDGCLAGDWPMRSGLCVLDDAGGCPRPLEPPPSRPLFLTCALDETGRCAESTSSRRERLHRRLRRLVRPVRAPRLSPGWPPAPAGAPSP